MLLETLERVEQHGEKDVGFIERELRFWQFQDRILLFVTELDEALRNGFAANSSEEERRSLIKIGLARHLGLRANLESKVRTMALDLLVEETRLGTIEPTSPIWYGYLSEYAKAIRAVNLVSGSPQLTPIGKVFLQLAGRDAVRWLLQVEVIQSLGPRDPARLSRGLAREMLSSQEQKVWWTWEGDNPFWPRLLASRLVGMGVLDGEDSNEPDEDGSNSWTLYSVTALGDELLDELLRGDSPLSALAATLCADLAVSATRVATGNDSMTTSPAAEATARQARLVAHEIRNTLVPMQAALGSLYREVMVDSPTEVLQKRRPQIDRGVERIFGFIDQIVRVSALAATPPEVFDAVTAIRDAVAELGSMVSIMPNLVIRQPLPPLYGLRSEFVMALVNLLRNAAQHGGPKLKNIKLIAESADESKAVLMTLDDDGQGIPANLREAIFAEGVSLLPGGSGLGLRLCREVFEREMKGVIVCEDSPLGGARFRIRLPAAGVLV